MNSSKLCTAFSISANKPNGDGPNNLDMPMFKINDVKRPATDPANSCVNPWRRENGTGASLILGSDQHNPNLFLWY